MDECELTKIVEEKRKAAEAEHAVIRDDLAHRHRIESISRQMGNLTNEQIDRRRAEALDREKEREFQSRVDRWLAFVARRGDTYGKCRVGNYEATTDAQRHAVERLTAYCENITDEIAAGTNIVLFGSMGTGKDHLLCAMARHAILLGKRVDWWNGMDLFGRVRDRMSSEEPEEGFVRALASPHVLYISDPLPPSGEPLTAFQMQFIARVVDARYSKGKPTWLSVNVKGRAEFETKMGPPTVDRLCDNSISLFFNWPSHRGVKHG